MSGRLRIKRIYDQASEADGQRVLVDRLWPRGVSREAAALAFWLKDIAPSHALRKWFGHDPARWSDFKSAYCKELEANHAVVAELCQMLEQGDVTLLYAAHDQAFNHAIVLSGYLRDRCHHILT